jgi:ribonuclease VapC
VILDTSAVVAVLLKEAPSATLIEKLLRQTEVGIGAPTLAETALVLSARLQRDARGILSRFIAETSVVVIPFGEPHYGSVVDAWLRFGKARDPARLNFGACLAYATARVADRPLLCTGDDFAKTDLELA